MAAFYSSAKFPTLQLEGQPILNTRNGGHRTEVNGLAKGTSSWHDLLNFPLFYLAKEREVPVSCYQITTKAKKPTIWQQQKCQPEGDRK